MRNIKPMKELELTSTLSKILILVTFFAGGLVAIFLWNTSRTPENSKYSQSTYNPSELQKFINILMALIIYKCLQQMLLLKLV